jgi:hypothetical protein
MDELIMGQSLLFDSRGLAEYVSDKLDSFKYVSETYVDFREWLRCLLVRIVFMESLPKTPHGIFVTKIMLAVDKRAKRRGIKVAREVKILISDVLATVWRLHGEA